MNASLVAYSIMFSCLSIYFSMKMGMDDDTDESLFSLNSVAALTSAIAAVALGIEAILTPC